VAKDPVRIEIAVPAPFEAVWQAFRDPAVIAEWFGWEYEGLVEEIEYIFGEHTEAYKEGGTLDIGDFHFRLDDHDTETVVKATRRPADAKDRAASDAPFDDIEEGWLTFLHQLRFALARHPGRTRRTVHLAGFRTGPKTTTVERLGLAEAASTAAGRRYRIRTPWGDPMAGKQWFRTTNQLGVTVDQWGDGLLILFEAPGGQPATSPVSAVLTTYGLDDRQFERLEEGWTEWWTANHRVPADTPKEQTAG
jgi:hypothetical protein